MPIKNDPKERKKVQINIIQKKKTEAAIKDSGEILKNHKMTL